MKGDNLSHRDVAKWARTSVQMVADFYDEAHPQRVAERVAGFRNHPAEPYGCDDTAFTSYSIATLFCVLSSPIAGAPSCARWSFSERGMHRHLLIATLVQTLAILVSGCSTSFSVSKVKQEGSVTVVSVTCYQPLDIKSVRMNGESELIPWEATNAATLQRAVVFAMRSINRQQAIAYADGLFLKFTDFRPLPSVPCRMGETRDFAYDARLGDTLVKFTIDTNRGSRTYQWRD